MARLSLSLISPARLAIALHLLVGLGQAMPYFTNSVYNLEPGEPFEITWAGARGAVNITLRNGPVDDLRPVAVIDTNDSRNFFTWVPPSSLTMSLPSGTYDFQIEDSDGTNYSAVWSFVGSVTTDNETLTTTAPSSTQTIGEVNGSSALATSDGTGLNPGARAGIGVGAGVGGIFLLASAAFVFSRIRRAKHAPDHDSRWWLGAGKAELDAGDKIRPELGGTAVSEMDGIPWKQQPAELAAAGEHDDEKAELKEAESMSTSANSDDSESEGKPSETSS